MRLVMWIENYHPVVGGIQTAIRQYLPALRQLGHEVVVVASHYWVQLPDFMCIDNIPVHRFHFKQAIEEKNPAAMLQEQRRVTHLIREFAPDLVHIMGFGPSNLFFLRTQRSYPCPYLVSIRNEESRRFEDTSGAALLRQLLAGADWVTTASQFEAQRLAALLPAIAAKITCLYHGLLPPPEPLSPLPPTQYLTCIGRFVDQKNFDLAVQAFARIAPDFPAARLIFAGDGPERPLIETLVAELGLNAQVDLLGWVEPEQIPALINQARAVVLPSRWEGLPLTGIQTAQMARPLIATHVSGTPELVVDGETGLLVPSGDVETLAAAMRRLLSDPALAAHMGQAAHARLYATFSLAKMIENYLALYARLLAAAPVNAGDGGE